jgi:hypothetical protein
VRPSACVRRSSGGHAPPSRVTHALWLSPALTWLTSTPSGSPSVIRPGMLSGSPSAAGEACPPVMCALDDSTCGPYSESGWEIAHAAVTPRPPISLNTMVSGTGSYAYDVGVWELSIIQGAFSVAPRQTVRVPCVTIRNLFIAVDHPGSIPAQGVETTRSRSWVEGGHLFHRPCFTVSTLLSLTTLSNTPRAKSDSATTRGSQRISSLDHELVLQADERGAACGEVRSLTAAPHHPNHEYNPTLQREGGGEGTVPRARERPRR